MTRQELITYLKSNDFKHIYIQMPYELRKVIRDQFCKLPSGGSNNHFCELQYDATGNVWVMQHFGSRHLGYSFGEYFNKLAKEFNQLWYSTVPDSVDLAFLPLDTTEAKLYLLAVELCEVYAKANHGIAMRLVQDILNNALGCARGEYLYVPHNYVRKESHYGENVLVHRKGATSATLDEIGIIPGSQGTNSYIVKGRGNPESFMSCSHGAGRRMGRKEAIRTLSLKDEIERLDKLGIIHGIRTDQDLDEATGAYKSIDVVMEEQKDLVDIIHKLTPIAVIKG